MVGLANLVPAGLGVGIAMMSLVAITGIGIAIGATLAWVPAGIDWSTAAIVTAAGIIEELIFRGPLFSWLRRRYRDSLAVSVCAVLFSGAHAFNPGMSVLAAVNVGIAGVLLGLLRVRTETLMAPIAFHVGWNVLVAAFIGAVSGVGSSGWWTTLQTEGIDPALRWLITGPFGIEQGLVTSITLLAAIVVVVGWIHPSRSRLVTRMRHLRRHNAL